jgi:phenylpropionate dioxygenase-like ring-hydroxylating dioxygenase large terminal subunit
MDAKAVTPIVLTVARFDSVKHLHRKKPNHGLSLKDSKATCLFSLIRSIAIRSDMADDIASVSLINAVTEMAVQDGLLRDCWYFAATSAELKAGKQFRRMILGEPVLLGRTAYGDVLAMRDVCPHRGVPLSEGRQVETGGVATVECPYHGWRFGADGGCKLVPSLYNEDNINTTKIKVRHYPSHEANGLVFVYVASDPRFDGVPELAPPDLGIKVDKPKFAISRVFEVDMDNAVLGFIDPGHVPFVHNQWWWRPRSGGLKLKDKKFEPTLHGWAIAKHKPSSAGVYKFLFGEGVTSEIVFKLPGYRWETVQNAKGQFLTLSCMTPMDAKTTLITQITYWTGNPLIDLLRPILIPAANKFLSQDMHIVNLQGTSAPFMKGMMMLGQVDEQAKWYYKSKREWTDSCAQNRDYANPVVPTLLKWLS